jgi:hypothetical protein
MSAQLGGERAEVERLRERVAALEAELVTVEAWAYEAVASAQKKTYWLDRWHVDLNELMARPSAERLRAAARAVRSVVRAGRRVKRSLLP